MVKYLLYTNEGASDMALNCVYSMLTSGIAKEDIFVYTIDEETESKFSEYNIDVTKLDASKSLGSSDLRANDDYQDWNTKGFHRVVHYKIKAIIDALHRGHDVFYLDTDNVLFKNPTEFAESNSENIDILIQDDSDVHGRWKSLCTGVVFIKSNDTTKKFYEKCLELHLKNIELDKSTGDQAAFNQILMEKNIHGLNNINVVVFPHVLFPNGQVYFETDISNEQPYLLHNNYISGLENKIQRFKDNNLWFIDDDNFYDVLKGDNFVETKTTR